MEDILKDKKGALIDMDGVLYNSMKYHTLAWYKMMTEQGLNVTRDEFYLYEGMTGKATINHIFLRELGREATEEEVRSLYARKTELFRELSEPCIMPGAGDMLRALKNRGIRAVLVTGSGQASLLESLDRDYPGIFAPGDRITAADVSRGKPYPEPYLKGLEKAGCKASEAIVIENAPLGVHAGKEAGIFTIAVMTGPIPRTEFEKEKADMIFPSMPAFASYLAATNSAKS